MVSKIIQGTASLVLFLQVQHPGLIDSTFQVVDWILLVDIYLVPGIPFYIYG